MVEGFYLVAVNFRPPPLRPPFTSLRPIREGLITNSAYFSPNTTPLTPGYHKNVLG